MFSLVDSNGNQNEHLFAWNYLLPRIFLRSDKKEISVGSGGLWLGKGMLNGTSSVSATFKNEPLHGDKNNSFFKILCIELLSFIEPSKKVYELHTY